MEVNKKIVTFSILILSLMSCSGQSDKVMELRKMYTEYFKVFLEPSNSAQIRALDLLRMRYLSDSLYSLQTMQFENGYDSDVLTLDYGVSEESINSLKVVLIDGEDKEYLICYDILLSDVSGKNYLDNVCFKVKIMFFENQLKICSVKSMDN